MNYIRVSANGLRQSVCMLAYMAIFLSLKSYLLLTSAGLGHMPSTASSLAHRADVRGSHSPLMSLLRALAHALRPSLLQRRAVSTAPSLRGLEEFFEKPPAEGEKVVVGEHRPRAL